MQGVPLNWHRRQGALEERKSRADRGNGPVSKGGTVKDFQTHIPFTTILSFPTGSAGPGTSLWNM